MKKLTAIILCLTMIFAFAACGGGGDDPQNETTTYTLLIGTTVQDDSATGIALLEYFKP